MRWNELSYDVQRKVYKRFEEALLKEQSLEVQDAIVAAMEELEMWDNKPCSVQVNGEVLPSYYVAEASDPFLCCDCLVPGLCPCHCHKE